MNSSNLAIILLFSENICILKTTFETQRGPKLSGLIVEGLHMSGFGVWRLSTLVKNWGLKIDFFLYTLDATQVRVWVLLRLMSSSSFSIYRFVEPQLVILIIHLEFFRFCFTWPLWRCTVDNHLKHGTAIAGIGFLQLKARSWMSILHQIKSYLDQWKLKVSYTDQNIGCS